MKATVANHLLILKIHQFRWTFRALIGKYSLSAVLKHDTHFVARDFDFLSDEFEKLIVTPLFATWYTDKITQELEHESNLLDTSASQSFRVSRADDARVRRARVAKRGYKARKSAGKHRRSPKSS